MSRSLIVLIILGVLAWGALLAVGSYYGGGRLIVDVRRGLVVFGCTLAFLAFWLVMLQSRKKRLEREAEEDEPI